jgi:hypothetical protein
MSMRTGIQAVWTREDAPRVECAQQRRFLQKLTPRSLRRTARHVGREVNGFGKTRQGPKNRHVRRDRGPIGRDRWWPRMAALTPTLDQTKFPLERDRSRRITFGPQGDIT